ncbi:hypothetical protein Tco_0961648 [Tanacetum coccineum]
MESSASLRAAAKATNSDSIVQVMDIQEKDKIKAKNDKTEHENGKSVKQSQSHKSKSQSQPREVDSEKASKTELKNINCQKNLNDVRDDVSDIDTLAIHGNHWGMIVWTHPRAKMDLKKHKDELKVKIEAAISYHTRKPGQGSRSF